ncbi:hypothetical protein RB653_002415 [Dictyostelium firmibasis]|uniref:Uncharacterized protein n=1 Tax=Dictyostelium firmibasis TaxID=79012 RepID=A0AAN7YMZ9_9MYCE
MIVPKLIGLNELSNNSNTNEIQSPTNVKSSRGKSLPTSPKQKEVQKGPMTPRTLFSKRESDIKNSSSYIIEDSQYLYILCRGCKMCEKRFQHYMTVKKHLKKKKKFFSF